MPGAKVPRKGKLEEHPLSSVLRSLLFDRGDGCLTVSRGAITRRLFLRGGMIISAASTEPSDRLGEILIAQGKLSRADHRRYWEESQAGNRLLGITLVVNGRISLGDLYQGVTAQVVTILDRVQKWRKGDYVFEEGVAPPAGTVLLCIPLGLYLKSDSEKRPTSKTSRRKGTGAAAAAAPAAAPHVPPAPEREILIDIPEQVPAPAGITPEDAQEVERLAEVSFMAQELRRRLGQEPPALLGVPAGSDRGVVQEAYHRIAKVLHPDRLPRACPQALRHEVEEMFCEVTAAWRAVAGETQGEAAQPTPAPAPDKASRVRGVPQEERQARRFFSQGREWITKRNYWQAADALRQAVRLRPEDPLFRQYLGLALMQTKRLHEAEEHLVEATRLEPANAAHFVNLGRIYRSGRLFKKAREAFERALRLEPRNAHAREELADLPEEPPPAARKPEGAGLLKKLFGK